ncbi:phenylacetate--CoA ligase family protein [Capillimicrobium parvum]|uniref:Phenylacetate-coenzyme A ligase n=1 Tax=Capillimicrobium parvum TaxID=2884022 RepID=A0A9E6XYZ2_9ACTN|nr:AMP-binding protein [Capillimicrobium parvum]UGS36896.1 Phenylacetate-coenzyme A ligase [Capillimicrobium parvum]
MSTASRDAWLAAVRRWKLHPDEPADERLWAPELEACSRDELHAIQSEKLVPAVQYLYEHSPLYASLCAACGIEPGDVTGREQLADLPVVTKDDMSRSLAAAAPWGTYTAIDDERWLTDGWQVFATSGTTSQPRPFRYTQFDREMWTWADARAVHAMGIRGGRDVGMMLFGYGPHVAMWGLHHALIHIGVPIVPAGGLDTRTRAASIDRYGPTVIGCTPSYALHLASVMRDMGLDPAASPVRVVIAMGEPLPESSARRIRDLWDAEVHQFYGCTEAAPSCGGYTCTAGSVHFLEDTHVLETLDPKTLKPVAPGSPGVAVVTNLISEASPQVRFLVGDYTALDHAGCACGRTHVVCEGGFTGRADDMLNVRGVTLFPSAVEDVVRGFAELGEEFQIVLERRAELDELILVAEPLPHVADDRHEELTLRLEGAFRARLELRPTIRLQPYGTLPKTEFKAKRVMDRRE